MQQAEMPSWYQGTGADFCVMAKCDPERLLAVLSKAALSAHELRDAAEATRFLADTKQAIKPLLQLSRSAERIVREGAVDGLRACAIRGDSYDRANIHEYLIGMMRKEVEASVKELITEALDD